MPISQPSGGIEMTVVEQLLETHPAEVALVDQDKLRDCIEACFECAQACTACADACLSESDVAQLRSCIALNLDCADICAATGRVLSRLTSGDAGVLRSILEACATACKSCGDECARHADMHRHCGVCADACRRCEKACRELADSLR